MRRGSKNRGRKYYSDLNHPSVQRWLLYTSLTSSDWKSIDISLLYLCSIVMQLNTCCCSTHYNLVLWPILYKFFVLGSLGQESIRFELGLQIVTLQLVPSVGRTCASMSATVKHGEIKSTPSKSTPNRACKFSTAGQFS